MYVTAAAGWQRQAADRAAASLSRGEGGGRWAQRAGGAQGQNEQCPRTAERRAGGPSGDCGRAGESGACGMTKHGDTEGAGGGGAAQRRIRDRSLGLRDDSRGWPREERDQWRHARSGWRKREIERPSPSHRIPGRRGWKGPAGDSEGGVARKRPREGPRADRRAEGGARKPR